MSGVYVTDSGFVKKTLAEIKLELENAYKLVFGDDIDLDPSGPFGQLIGLSAKRESNLWDAAQEIYTSRNPDQATGISLDNIASITGLTRIGATPTQVLNVYLYGDEGTVIPVGSQAKQANQNLIYTLDSAVTITKSALRIIQLTPDAPSGAGGDLYTIDIDSVSYGYTSLAGDTVADVIDALILDISGGSWVGSATNISDTHIQLEDIDTDFSVVWSATLSLNVQAAGGNFTASETGENTLSANSLNTIITPISGWNSVINVVAGTSGFNEETDDSLRIRRISSLSQGLATDSAIAAKIINDVSNILSAIVISNRTSTTDAESRPPKSFEAIVEGGLDQDIGDKIWEVQPSGIESYGNTSVSVTDSEGNLQTVKFSRPESMYIHVRVSRELYSEEDYPTLGDDLIKSAIVDWAETNQTVGKDVIRQRLSIPIYSVSGVGEILIEIDSTPNPGDTPTYAEDDIPINSREIAEFATSRIIVQDLI